MTAIATTQRVQRSIDQLIADFQAYPNKYLTEDDVRMHLCSILMQHFGHIEETKDDSQSIALHTEIRWFGEERYRDRSDIVIFDVSDLEVTQENVRSKFRAGCVPGKGFAFNTPVAVIELKLRRILGASQPTYKKKLSEDYSKLKRIKTMMDGRGKPEINYWLVAFDKTNDIGYQAPEFLERVHVSYVFSN